MSDRAPLATWVDFASVAEMRAASERYCPGQFTYVPTDPERSRRVVEHALAWWLPKPTRWQRIKNLLRRWTR